MVIMRTTFGEIKLELDAERAPKTVANFLMYAREGFYDGTIFHRVIDNFMIQGGGFDIDMNQKPTGTPIENEADNGLKNDFGTIAMARTMEPHSATAQFFINVKDNDFLDKPRDGAGYAVFGRVAAGMSVVDAIKVVPTGVVRGRADVPISPVIINEIRRMDAEEAHRFIRAEKGEPSKGGGR